MLENILKLSRHFLTIKNRPYKRYLLNSTELKHRCTILLGQRGIGKTTTLIQYLLNHSDDDVNDPRILYVQTDHLLMGDLTLYEIAETFQANGGEIIAFDEIHKYEAWSQELKSIYDTFPNLTILASGSSALEIHKGSHDLSRRAIIRRLHGLSFREFIELQNNISFENIELTDLLKNHESIARTIVSKLEDTKILALFKSYLDYGFYPYFLEINDTPSYWLTLEQNVHITIESDLVAIYPYLTGTSIKKIKQLLIFISTSVPFTPNWTNIKKVVDVSDDRTVKSYFKYLEDASLIRLLQSDSKKFSKIEKPEKIYLNNPNQIQAITSGNGNIGNLRETFFLSMLVQSHDVNLPTNGDFIVDHKYTFEIGGPKKDYNQIKNISDAYLASDNIELGINQRIPLWLFGFLY